MNRPEESKCVIKRTGIVVSADADEVQLEIEGKRLVVPAEKCDPSVRTGDRVAWNGARWIAMQDEA